MTPDAKRRWDNMASFLQIGIAASVFTKNYADAGAIAMHGPDFTKALAKQADKNEKLAKLLDYLGAIGPYSEILGAGLPLVLQIMANHKRVPAEAVANFGVVPPRMLETKVRLEIKQQEAELMQQLKDQEQQIEQMNITLFDPSSLTHPDAAANGYGKANADTPN